MDTNTNTINNNVDIFIYSHIPFKPIVANPVYKVLTNNHTPDEEFRTNLPIYRDYEGDNISDKNLMFNEYAGFYWILHNWDIKDYIGMIHYGRYFNFLDDIPNIEKIFSYGIKIILNKKFFLRYPMGSNIARSNREYYEIWHNANDFDLMGQIVKENYPQYADGWDRMAACDYIYPSSLFIMKTDMFKEYMTYALDVMNKFNDARGCHTPEEWIAYVEAHKDEYVREQHRYYDVKMQARATGYLVERCLAAFLMAGDDPIVSHAAEYEWSVLPPSSYQTRK